jgi:hypothetical protein
MKQFFFIALITLLLTSCNLIDKFRDRGKDAEIPEISGTWEIIYYKGEDDKGRLHYPFDEVKGMAVFDKHNNYTIQFYAAERDNLSKSDPFFGSDAELRITFLTSRSAFGTYSVEGDFLILKPEAANIPNLASQPEKRPYIIKGDSMLMYSPPIRWNGIEMIEHTLWVRRKKVGE